MVCSSINLFFTQYCNYSLKSLETTVCWLVLGTQLFCQSAHNIHTLVDHFPQKNYKTQDIFLSFYLNYRFFIKKCCFVILKTTFPIFYVCPRPRSICSVLVIVRTMREIRMALAFNRFWLQIIRKYLSL